MTGEEDGGLASVYGSRYSRLMDPVAREGGTMPPTSSWSRVLLIVGLIGMLLGAIDPLEGSLIILPGAGLAALGASLGKSRYRALVYWALALVAVGVVAMWVSSAFGGFGGGTGRSVWWGLPISVPYAVGWVMGVAGTVLSLVEFFRHPGRPDQGEQAG